jgi:hypothetical protein
MLAQRCARATSDLFDIQGQYRNESHKEEGHAVDLVLIGTIALLTVLQMVTGTVRTNFVQRASRALRAQTRFGSHY